jgi:DNA-binding response OmpR family regulator
MKVLLIEDDAPCAELLMLRLAQLGCTVVSTDDAEQALALAMVERPNLVITDLRLSSDRLGGFRLIRKLREMEETARVPIIVHSVYALDSADIPELESMIDGVLPKPFTFAQLKALVQAQSPLLAS